MRQVWGLGREKKGKNSIEVPAVSKNNNGYKSILTRRISMPICSQCTGISTFTEPIHINAKVCRYIFEQRRHFLKYLKKLSSCSFHNYA